MARNRRYVEFNKDGLPPPATECAPPAPVVVPDIPDPLADPWPAPLPPIQSGRLLRSNFSNLPPAPVVVPVPTGQLLRSFLPTVRVASVEYVSNRVEYGRPDPGLQNYSKPIIGAIPWGASLLDDDDPAAARAIPPYSFEKEVEAVTELMRPTPIDQLWQRVKAIIAIDGAIEPADAGLVDWEFDSLADFAASMRCGEPITETRKAIIKLICDNCKLKDTPY